MKKAQETQADREEQIDVSEFKEQGYTAKQERKRAYVSAIGDLLMNSVDLYKTKDLRKLHLQIKKLQGRRWSKEHRKLEKQARKNRKENSDDQST